MLFIATIARADYIITESELNQLEATIQRQSELLTEQLNELTALKKEIEVSKMSLQKAQNSFAEYEAAALTMQQNLRIETAQIGKKLQNARMALAIAVPAAAIAGAVLGVVLASLPPGQ